MLEKMYRVFLRMPEEIQGRLFEHRSYVDIIRVCFCPRSVLVLAGGHRILPARQDLFTWKRQLQAFRGQTKLLW